MKLSTDEATAFIMLRHRRTHDTYDLARLLSS